MKGDELRALSLASDLEAEPSMVQNYYGVFPNSFTIHLVHVDHEDIYGLYHLRDENGYTFQAFKAYHFNNKRAITLYTTPQLDSPILATINKNKAGDFLAKRSLTLPSPPSQPSTEPLVLPVYHVADEYQFEVPAPTFDSPDHVEKYDWQEVKKTPNPRPRQLFRVADNEVMCRVSPMLQPQSKVIKDNDTLRATVAFEGKGLTELDDYARLAIVLGALDLCHKAAKYRLIFASKWSGPGKDVEKRAKHMKNTKDKIGSAAGKAGAIVGFIANFV
ncbi:hypothetical protein VHEMI09462 [[Torrubiella] hemipterigena]|uniref:Uncharacterized protein n=1 Tax=[Torrubiella] hemipterigena TaxID=1531966 RepID=A0A0A1T9Y5_9HYPO|nr:hypothetical protein VHEMI09462 [[Torrubiella] hemipterigena]